MSFDRSFSTTVVGISRSPQGELRRKRWILIPPVNTILLVGFHNAGKRSLVNLMYSVLGRSGLIPFAQTSSGELR